MKYSSRSEVNLLLGVPGVTRIIGQQPNLYGFPSRMPMFLLVTSYLLSIGTRDVQTSARDGSIPHRKGHRGK